MSKMVSAVKKMDADQMNEQINKNEPVYFLFTKLTRTIFIKWLKERFIWRQSAPILLQERLIERGCFLVRKDVQEFVMAEEERIKFIRQRPLWYRQLTRHPDKLSSFELDKMNFYEKTIPHRVSQLSNSVQMAEMMIQMFQAMRNQNGAG